MSSSSQRIAKNTTYLTMALIVQKVIAFFFFLMIAHRLGGAGTGEYVSAFAFSSFFGVLVDLGLGPVLIRELARSPAKTEILLRATLGLKLVLAVVAYILLITTIYVLDFFALGHPAVDITAVAGVIMIVDSLALTGTSVFRGWQTLWYESLIIVINKLAVIIFGAFALWLYPTAFSVAVAILISGLGSLLLLTHYLQQRVDRPWRPTFDYGAWLYLGRLAWPFAVAGFFATTYSYIDSMLLSIIQGNGAVGLYSVASKTMNAFLFIPSAFSAALYPAMSVPSQQTDTSLASILEQSLRYLLLISAPIAVGMFVLATEFVTRVGADYIDSAVAVRILLPSLVFVFLSFPFGALLNATNRQNWQTAIIAGGTLANIVLNIFLIPRFSYVGASIAWFLTNAAVVVASFIIARRVVNYSLRAFFVTLSRVLLAIGLMTIVLIYLKEGWPLIVTVAAAALVYGGALFAVKEISRADIQRLIGYFRPDRIAADTHESI